MSSVAIDEALLEKAFEISVNKTKKEIIDIALEEYIEHHQAEELIKMFGTIDYDEKYDYKEMGYSNYD